jgi:cell division protein FtsB
MKSNILYFALVLALILYLIFGNRGLIEYNNLLDIRKKYAEKVDNLSKRIDELEHELYLLQKDKEFLETVIREDLNLKKPDEDLYILRDGNEEIYSNRDNKSSKESD